MQEKIHRRDRSIEEKLEEIKELRKHNQEVVQACEEYKEDLEKGNEKSKN